MLIISLGQGQMMTKINKLMFLNVQKISMKVENEFLMLLRVDYFH